MTKSLGWTFGALAGSLVGGLAITGMMIAGEAKDGDPSELTVLGRASAARLGIDGVRSGSPSLAEQSIFQGGHLVLSLLGGLAYAAAFDEDAAVLPSGLTFGEAFYVAAHVVSGPALRVKTPEWKQEPSAIGKHLFVHAAFGLLTALGARLGASLSRKELF